MESMTDEFRARPNGVEVCSSCLRVESDDVSLEVDDDGKMTCGECSGVGGEPGCLFDRRGRQ